MSAGCHIVKISRFNIFGHKFFSVKHTLEDRFVKIRTWDQLNESHTNSSSTFLLFFARKIFDDFHLQKSTIFISKIGITSYEFVKNQDNQIFQDHD